MPPRANNAAAAVALSPSPSAQEVAAHHRKERCKEPTSSRNAVFTRCRESPPNRIEPQAFVRKSLTWVQVISVLRASRRRGEPRPFMLEIGHFSDLGPFRHYQYRAIRMARTWPLEARESVQNRNNLHPRNDFLHGGIRNIIDAKNHTRRTSRSHACQTL